MQFSPYFLYGENGAKGTVRGREEGIFGGKKSVKISEEPIGIIVKTHPRPLSFFVKIMLIKENDFGKERGS